MSHNPDIKAESPPDRPLSRKEILARETASAYARAFSTDDGQRVLADLRAKFGHNRPRFPFSAQRHEPIRAALIDGQCSVLGEIESSIEAGGGTIHP